MSEPKLIDVDQDTLDAMELSVQKWIKVVEQDEDGSGGDDCALCQRFHWRFLPNDILKQHDWMKPRGFVNCAGCPIYRDTELNCCNGTPYVLYDFAMGREKNTKDPMVRKHAADMLAYLRDLQSRLILRKDDQ